MSDSQNVPNAVPSECDTDGCHREPDRNVRFISESEGVESRERWLCEPCETMAREGNRWPGGGNVRPINEVAARE